MIEVRDFRRKHTRWSLSLTCSRDANPELMRLALKLATSAGKTGGEELDTQETEGQMLQRVMPALMGMKDILVINDEAHHCYREKPDDGDDEELKGDEKKEAEKNKKAARVWISGLEAVNRKLVRDQERSGMNLKSG
jgi:hypothetical protein